MKINGGYSDRPPIEFDDEEERVFFMKALLGERYYVFTEAEPAEFVKIIPEPVLRHLLNDPALDDLRDDPFVGYEYAYTTAPGAPGKLRIFRTYQSLAAFLKSGYNEIRGHRRRVGAWEPVNRQGSPAGVKTR